MLFEILAAIPIKASAFCAVISGGLALRQLWCFPFTYFRFDTWSIKSALICLMVTFAAMNGQMMHVELISASAAILAFTSISACLGGFYFKAQQLQSLHRSNA